MSCSYKKPIFLLVLLVNLVLAHASYTWVLSAESYQAEKVAVAINGNDLFLSAGEHSTVKLIVDDRTSQIEKTEECALVMILTHDGRPCSINAPFNKCRRVIAIMALDSRGPAQLRALENIIRRKHLVGDILEVLKSNSIDQHFAVVEFDQA